MNCSSIVHQLFINHSSIAHQSLINQLYSSLAQLIATFKHFSPVFVFVGPLFSLQQYGIAAQKSTYFLWTYFLVPPLDKNCERKWSWGIGFRWNFRFVTNYSFISLSYISSQISSILMLQMMVMRMKQKLFFLDISISSVFLFCSDTLDKAQTMFKHKCQVNKLLKTMTLSLHYEYIP